MDPVEKMANTLLVVGSNVTSPSLSKPMNGFGTLIKGTDDRTFPFVRSIVYKRLLLPKSLVIPTAVAGPVASKATRLVKVVVAITEVAALNAFTDRSCPDAPNHAWNANNPPAGSSFR